MKAWLISGMGLAASLVMTHGAHAQTASANVVVSCGTPPTTYTPPYAYPETQDTLGRLCSASGVGTAAVTPALTSSLTITGKHILLGFHMTVTNSTGGYAMMYDALTPPADGAVQPAGCFVIPAPVSPQTSTTLSMANTPTGAQFNTGITLVFSTTGCFTQTSSAAAFMSALYQ